ncbi:MAG: pentapeptide repeat-containing protein [Acidobacteriota bacterium]
MADPELVSLLRSSPWRWNDFRRRNHSAWQADLTEADLSLAALSDINLTRANLSGANLTDTDLSGANLTDTNLSDANLSGANLSEANLSGAYLSGANLGDANLSDASLIGSNLSDANLSNANLFAARVMGADLTRVNLSGAKIVGASFGGAYIRHGILRNKLSALMLVRGHRKEFSVDRLAAVPDLADIAIISPSGTSMEMIDRITWALDQLVQAIEEDEGRGSGSAAGGAA